MGLDKGDDFGRAGASTGRTGGQVDHDCGDSGEELWEAASRNSWSIVSDFVPMRVTRVKTLMVAERR